MLVTTAYFSGTLKPYFLDPKSPNPSNNRYWLQLLPTSVSGKSYRIIEEDHTSPLVILRAPKGTLFSETLHPKPYTLNPTPKGT